MIMESSDRGGASSGGFRVPAFILLAVAVVAVLFLSVRFGAALLAKPSFCASCHVMQTQYVSHRRSAHQRASCVDCHAGKECGGCHGAITADASTAGKVVNAAGRGTHEVHVLRQNINCRVCHEGIMHARLDGYIRTSSNASCGRCHGQTELGEKAGRHLARNAPGEGGL